MNIKYKHTNIVARDWQTLATFYEKVFDCKRVLPERHLSGGWLEMGTGVVNARLSGIHLLLPGHGSEGPTLEIFQYSTREKKPPPAANREGFGHIAFEVTDVEAVLEAVCSNGGKALGTTSSHTVENVGELVFVYALDPEGNVIELQNWHPESPPRRKPN